jgi:hypothetical protein
VGYILAVKENAAVLIKTFLEVCLTPALITIKRFTNLDVPTCTNICLWWFDFRLNPIFTTALAASKNDTPFKSGQNRLENNHPALLI